MPSFDAYQKMYGGKTQGQVRKDDSDLIDNVTWWEDIGAKIAYIYDYYHDDEPLQFYPMHPENSKTKVPIDIKFIVNAYNSENKDQVGYHIQFRPGQQCPLDYYEKAFKKKYQAEFPIALYIDIPDEQGIYRKWLITEGANWLGLQFPTWYVLPIDHIFQWIYKGTKYQMCGVGRSQSSYNQGTWIDYRVETVENQRKCILPMNDISATIFYDQRIVLSAPIEEPVVWRCTKVEQISPKGIDHLTFAQAKWNSHTDYIEKDEEGNVVAMWCDYFDINDNPAEDPESPSSTIYCTITHSGTAPEIKTGGSYKKFTVTFYDTEGETAFQSGTWSFAVDGVDVSSLLTIRTKADDPSLTDNQIKIKFAKDDSYIGKNLEVKFEATATGIKDTQLINIVGL